MRSWHVLDAFLTRSVLALTFSLRFGSDILGVHLTHMPPRGAGARTRPPQTRSRRVPDAFLTRQVSDASETRLERV